MSARSDSKKIATSAGNAVFSWCIKVNRSSRFIWHKVFNVTRSDCKASGQDLDTGQFCTVLSNNSVEHRLAAAFGKSFSLFRGHHQRLSLSRWDSKLMKDSTDTGDLKWNVDRLAVTLIRCWQNTWNYCNSFGNMIGKTKAKFQLVCCQWHRGHVWTTFVIELC